MASTTNGGTLPPNFMLTPQQQSLLFAALNSNKPQISRLSEKPNMAFSTSSPKSSLVQGNNNASLQDSPFLDNYDYDFGDSSFDFSFADGDQTQPIGDDVPDTTRSESTGDNELSEIIEKRSHPDDDDDEESVKDPKRRESTEKVPKKPGRKPLTSEPSSKRKAQNRAAQRAFRERKEKHVKDLETKVEELEKQSEAANHENTQLRARVERMTVELNQYKQKMAVISNARSSPRSQGSFGSTAVSNLGDVNFEFNFPKFGALPGPTTKPQRSGSQPISPQSQNQTPSNPPKAQTAQNDQFSKDDFANLAKFSGVFTPSMSSSVTNGSRGSSLDSANFSIGAGTSSPSASSHSNMGPSSSCGTSPEPFTQSPIGYKPMETMTTIGEEQSSLATEPFSQFANVDFSNTNFDWLAQQNGGQFDPQLFGDYREPQENILSNPSFDEFFNDAIDADFITPYNMAPSPALHKKNIIDEIDAQKDDFNDHTPSQKNMNCNQIWEKLQSCPKAQNGEFDLDGLCSELTKKAKCSGSGPVVGEHDFDHLLKKYMGKDLDPNCVASSLGIEVDRKIKSNGVGMP